MQIFLVVLTILTTSLYPVIGCGTANVQCVTQTTYQFCFLVGTEVVLVDGVQTCPSGTICNENGTAVCEVGTTTESTTTITTTPAPGSSGNCTAPDKYPADTCNQYWECLAVMWWYELVLQTCDTGLSYNETSQECSADGACAGTTTTTQATTVTTTVTSATGPPETCTEAGKYPAEACNQYWECLLVMWWYELVLQTCGTNQAYDSASQACVANSSCSV